jgi:hypothetical protein
MFSKAKEESKIERIPSGSYSVDRTGKVGVSTLPRSFSQDNVKAITDAVLGAFQTAREANVPLTEIFISFGALKITAREQRGGAMIFLAPRA